MKSFFLALLPFAFAFTAHAGEIRIHGAAAAELYEKLAILEVAVQDEHGGPAFATAKYGSKVGCIKESGVSGPLFECWIFQDEK